ncbi:MAG: hypothetical protein HRU20_10540 [Pseudomonadales bacterium]|nr:hypothetical protein [Pseudomonadales bacterium]
MKLKTPFLSAKFYLPLTVISTSFLFSACFDSDSLLIPTTTITPVYTVRSIDDKHVYVSAKLTSSLASSIELDNSEQLTASFLSETKVLEHEKVAVTFPYQGSPWALGIDLPTGWNPFNAMSYAAGFSGNDATELQIDVNFNRAAGLKSTHSFVTMPQASDILAPASGDVFHYNDNNIEVQWSNFGVSETVTLRMKGACHIEGYYFSTNDDEGNDLPEGEVRKVDFLYIPTVRSNSIEVADTGSYTLTAMNLFRGPFYLDTFIAADPAHENLPAFTTAIETLDCDVQLAIVRKQTGEVDALYVDGSITAENIRTISGIKIVDTLITP